MDTSQNKKYSGIVFGSTNEINNLYKILESKLKKNCEWQTPFHWRELAYSGRYCIYKSAIPCLEETKLKFFVFEHKKGRDIRKDKYYLKIIPHKITFYLEGLLNKSFGVLNIECDRDYEIKGKEKSTTISFLKHFVNSISSRLSVKPAKLVYVKPDLFYADIFHDEYKLRVNAEICKSQYSKSIQIIDLVLGMFFYNKKEMTKRKIINFHRIY